MYGKVFVFCILVVATQAVIEIPDYLLALRCRKSDPDYNGCLKYGTEHAFPYFVKGIKELDFPPLDPFKVDYFAVNRTIQDTIDIALVLKNMVVTGIKDTQFQKIKGDPYKLKGEVTMFVPRIHVNLEYDVRGKVFASPINIQGTMDGDFSNIHIAMKTSHKLYEKDGVEHFAVDKLDIKFALGDGKIKLTGSTPEQQATADFIMNLFNNNPRGIIDAMAPIAIEQSKGMLIEYMNKALAEVPASVLLPE